MNKHHATQYGREKKLSLGSRRVTEGNQMGGSRVADPEGNFEAAARQLRSWTEKNVRTKWFGVEISWRRTVPHIIF